MRLRGLLVFAVWGSIAAAQAPSTLWKARALDAKDRIAAMPDKATGATAAEARRLYWKLMIESAFESHLRAPSVAHQRTASGEAFHLLIPTKDKTHLFDIVYLYDPKGEPLGLRLDRLPPGWHVMLTPSSAESAAVVVDPGEPQILLMFTLAEPLEPRILITAPEPKREDRPPPARATTPEAREE